MTDAPTLRPDQLAMVEGIFAAWRAGRRGVLAIAPTGAGKGEMIRHLLSLAHASGRPALFAVHLDEIARDARNRLAAAGVPVRVLSGSRDEESTDAAVTIATWQTLAARDVTLPGTRLFVTDEAHRSAAPTFRAVLARHPQAKLVGFTATGQRGDGTGLGDAGFEVIVQGPQIRELVAAGLLAPVRVIAPDDYQDALAWEPAEAWSRWAGAQPGIVFASSVPESRRIAGDLAAMGVRAMHVDSETEGRADALARFEAGGPDGLDVLCCYRLFIEGINVRRAAVAMLATAFSYDGPMLQGIGRVRRAWGAKAWATVIDLRGNVWRRGFPDEDRVYTLDAGCSSAVSVEALPAVRQCPGCLAWVGPGGACSFCGASLARARKPARVVRSELRQQDEARAARKRERQDKLPREGREWDIFAGLVRELRARGRGHVAAFAFMRRVGHFPRWRVDHVPEEPGAGEVV